MIIEILAVGCALGVGLVLGRPRDKRMRCGARDEFEVVEGPNYNRKVVGYKYSHCSEPADRRCLANHCTKHCRAQDRCMGECLKEIA